MVMHKTLPRLQMKYCNRSLQMHGKITPLPKSTTVIVIIRPRTVRKPLRIRAILGAAFDLRHGCAVIQTGWITPRNVRLCRSTNWTRHFNETGSAISPPHPPRSTFPRLSAAEFLAYPVLPASQHLLRHSRVNAALFDDALIIIYSRSRRMQGAAGINPGHITMNYGPPSYRWRGTATGYCG